MVAGSPRKVSFSPKEMIALGEEMIEWLKKNHPETLHLSEWYSIEKMFLYNEWKTFIQKEEFIPYYERALAIVGQKYLNKDSKVRDGISQRWQRVYFKDLKSSEDADADAEITRQKSISDKATDEEKSIFQKAMDMVEFLQGRASKSALNIDDSKINKEQKS